MPLILPLAESVSQPNLVGKKAANLSALEQATFRVPAGFCLTTEAYRGFASQSGLQVTIRDTLQGLDLDDLEALIAAAERIGAAFRTAPMPEQIEGELRQAYARLGGGRVAVRSSATLEDLANATFAGLHETYLNVQGEEALLGRVRECWASLYTPQAIRYRAERGFDQSEVALAALVQRMLTPDVAGVAFSVHPISGDPNEVHLSATYGLGEALVSGLVTPDLFVLRGPSLDLAYAEVGEKSIALRAAPDGDVLPESVPEEAQSALCLTPEQAREVALLTRRLSEHFGVPQDVEWAYQDGELFVLQSRPMILHPDQLRWESPVPDAHWFRNWRLGEWLSEPVTPLFATSLLPHLVEGREGTGFGHLGWSHRMYFSMRKPWYCIVNGYFYQRDDRDETTDEGLRAREGSPAERAARYQQHTAELRDWQQRLRPAYLRERLLALRRLYLRRASGPEILAHLDELYRDAAEWWHLVAPIGFGSEEGSVRHAYEELYPQADRPPTHTLFSGFDNRALASQRELFAITTLVREHPAVAAIFEEADPAHVLAELQTRPEARDLWQRLRRYLNRHGHQVFSLDLSTPTLGERPAVAVAALQGYLVHGAEPPGRELPRQRRERQAALRRLQRTGLREHEEWPVFHAQLAYRLLCSEIREDVFYDFQRLWPLMRRAVHELGARLVAARILDEPDDVYFLEQAELEATVEALEPLPVQRGSAPDVADALHARVAERREQWAQHRKLSPPDRIEPSGGGEPRLRSSAPRGQLVEDERGHRLIGLAASPGRARGAARVIRSMDEFGRMRKGDILVAVSTSPAWTVLFPLAAAVVTEVGGSATHSSLVAREYGLPAVVATGIATQVIRDGQLVTVDGSEGVVYLGDAPPGTATLEQPGQLRHAVHDVGGRIG